MYRNRKVKPVEVWVRRRPPGGLYRPGDRRRETPGIMSEWFYEVVLPGTVLLALIILTLLTFFL